MKRADKEAQKATGFPGSIPIVKYLVREIAETAFPRECFFNSQSDLLELKFWENMDFLHKKFLSFPRLSVQDYC